MEPSELMWRTIVLRNRPRPREGMALELVMTGGSNRGRFLSGSGRVVEWLRFCGQVFKSIFVPRIRILSRRDYRTQPGVLTPGTDKKGTRPEGGGREAFSALDAERDPQRISAAPSGRDLLSMCPGVETPGSVL